MHIIVVCGKDGCGKKKVLRNVYNTLSDKRHVHGKCIRANNNVMRVVLNARGVSIGVAGKIANIVGLINAAHGVKILVCSARDEKTAREYCNQIQQSGGEYIVFLKWKEPLSVRSQVDDMLCRQILVSLNGFKI